MSMTPIWKIYAQSMHRNDAKTDETIYFYSNEYDLDKAMAKVKAKIAIIEELTPNLYIEVYRAERVEGTIV